MPKSGPDLNEFWAEIKTIQEFWFQLTKLGFDF